MRAFFTQTLAATRPSSEGAGFPGLPHVLAAAVILPVFGAVACATALLITSLISFVVWLPMTALVLNRGAPLTEHDTAPVLTFNAKLALFGLWTATAWIVAAVAH